MMADTNDTLLLRLASQVKLFTGLPRTALMRLLGRAERVALPANGLFFDQGDPGESFYVLVMGQAVVEVSAGQGWVELTRLRSGDSFGEMTLLDERVRSARVRALEPCVSLYFFGRNLSDTPDIQVVILKNMGRLLAQRLKSSSTEVAALKAALKEAAGTDQQTAEETEAAARGGPGPEQT